jgi:aminoglycoside phosphotransferase
MGTPDDLRLLLEEAAPILDVGAAEAGGTLGDWRPRQATHRPGRSTVVQYRADVHRPRGRATTETFVVVCDGGSAPAVWRWPSDPSLPGLPGALDPERVAALLDGVGLAWGPVRLRARTYRPGRRAVVEVTGARGRLFLKVLRPDQVEALHDRHQLLARHLPVPEALGWTDAGVLVLAARPGHTLREALRPGGEAAPGPEALGALLDRLPCELLATPPRRDLVHTVDHHAAVIAATVPAARSRVEDLAGDLRAPRGAAGPLVPVHGDFYDAQVLVHGGRITGLLDVDTAGPGRRLDDLANCCAHLSVLGATRYGDALLAVAERHGCPAELRRRIAAAVLGLATGPFRLLERDCTGRTLRRLDLARAWLDGSV